MENFRKLGLGEGIIKVIKEHKFEKPSEIQDKTIPLILKGKDIIAGSATGSGKTLAFISRIIQNSKPGKGIQALILTPTRELAQQINDTIKKFSKYNPLRSVAVYGGVSIVNQIKALKKADIIVGTPGRLLDHINRNTIYLNEIQTLVLDEADRMLDMGFIDDVEKIVSLCNKNKQTLLFSATISYEIEKIGERYMKNPIKISAENYVSEENLEQIYYDVPDGLKFSLLVHLLKNEKSDLVMVFCNTKRNVDFVAENLKINNINAIAIHGGFSQSKRTSTMERFHKSNIKVLVATDVAARGLDIKNVSHIYNYDIPKTGKEYTHRIGRTARAGEKGKAINILASRDYDNFTAVLKGIETDIKKQATPYVKKVKIVVDDSRKFKRGFRNKNFGRNDKDKGDWRDKRNNRKNDRKEGRRGNKNFGRNDRNRDGRKNDRRENRRDGRKRNFSRRR